MGFDCDNQAATISGLLGVMFGAKMLSKSLTMPIKGWNKPFNDRYINITRFDMPDASIQDIINRTYNKAVELVCAKGGKVNGEIIHVNAKAQFMPPMEFCIGPNPDMEIGLPVNYSFACKANEKYQWKLIKGNLPTGVAFQNGRLIGTPKEAGKYPITLQLSSTKEAITKNFELLVKTRNIAPKADTIYANIRKLNEEVLDSCWITFGKPMYAKSVKVINDGIKNGIGSVFYSLAAKSRLPKIDYFGYGWKEKHNINMLVLNMGCLEEFGGWFTSLNIQYLGSDNHWHDVGNFKSIPELPQTDIVFFQPHFAQYVFEFSAVETEGIRILMDAKVQEHWHKYTKNVSSFISITELGVYEK
ncbi:MAG: ADP-ribosylglycohydrolase family protein, partial [Bacteroides sp.]|jgi:hypothetical protein|nr:ADP-ribosylglycohydrolase family protein [Bacteroides sp.]